MYAIRSYYARSLVPQDNAHRAGERDAVEVLFPRRVRGDGPHTERAAQ